MRVCQDYEELFKVLNACDVRYLVVGAQAVIFYSEPRYTKDMDVWIPPEINDAETVYEALKKFGAPLQGLSPGDFKDKKIIYQIGVPPVRIDIMMSVPGASAIAAWKKRRRTRYGNAKINVIDITDLIKAKRKAGRPQDRIDLNKLRDHSKRKTKRH